ncbi:MAG: hypothetical protein A3H98_11255 [Bacteroidetes bacterium RIFCSPLOWO2_02_FULL_36_8]|nr:MAG: hypothetical protein A3H98_11255 [Bacteroidetes bacterium RIFCSPLOWO2_02_FULL_36_8]OFY70572.1 MAG: hypothetical protein A3G23_07480 [Bacteroidetes bacterium RIFCSPLOWO2_12_FULL_37_12]
MTRILFSIILFLSFSAYGQESTQAKYKRFYFGIKFSPDYSYRTVTKNDNSLSVDKWTRIKTYVDSIYKPKLGYTTGINFDFKINSRVSIEAGIQYSNKGYQTISILTSSVENPEGGLAKNIINYHYLDFPIEVDYSFLKNKFQLIVSVGTVLNLFRKFTVKTIPETPTATFMTKTFTNNYSFKKFNISPTIGFGFRYKINYRMNIKVEPTLRYGIPNIDNKSFMATYLWNVGLNIGYFVGLWK